MARGSSPDAYGSEGSVPSVNPTGLGAPSISAHATPEDFGAQIGAGVQKVGEAGEQQAAKYATMAMETAQNTAEVGFIKDAGDLKAKYMQYEGSKAENMRPQYEAEMEALQTKWGQGLPLAAQHQYNLNTFKSLRYATTDYAGYAAGQQKEALMYTGVQKVDIGKMMAADPSVVLNDRQFGEQVLAPIVHGHQTQMDLDHPALKTDPKTGEVSFDESTPEGKAAKMQFQNNLDQSLGEAWQTRYSTLSRTVGPVAAYDKFQKDKDEMPPVAAAKIDASLQPQVVSAHASNISSTVMANADQEHREMLTNPQANAANSAIAFSLQHEGGYVPNDSGKGPTKYGINKESNPGVDVENLTQDEATKIMHDKYYLGVGADKMSPQMAMVASDTAVNMGVDKAKSLISQAGDDPQKLIDLRRAEYQRLATANPEHYGQYLKGWNDRLDDLEKNIGHAQSAQKPYATNPNGTILTTADYAASHRQYLFEQGDKFAQETMPDSIRFKTMVRERISQQISTAIEDQKTQYNQNNRNIDRAFNGEFTNGKKPTTWNELEAIPGIGDAVNFSNERTPEFIRAMDARITARANGSGDEHKNGEGYMDMLRSIHPVDGSSPTITTSNQIYDAQYQGKITDAGREKLLNELQNAKKDPAGAAAVAAKVSLYDQIHKQMSFQDVTDKKNPSFDPIGEARFSQAIPLMDQQLDKNRQAGIPDYKSFDTQDKDYIGNAAKPLLRTDAQKMVDKRSAALSAMELAQGDDMVAVPTLKAKLSSGILKGTQGSDEIRNLYREGKISKDTALSLGLQYGYVTLTPKSKSPIDSVPQPE